MTARRVTAVFEADEGYSDEDLANGVRAWLGNLEEEAGVEVLSITVSASPGGDE